MSHSFEAPSGRTYFHNEDFSGDVTLAEEGEPVNIPFQDIRALYLQSLRRRMVVRVEQATDNDDLEHLLLKPGLLNPVKKPNLGEFKLAQDLEGDIYWVHSPWSRDCGWALRHHEGMTIGGMVHLAKQHLEEKHG